MSSPESRTASYDLSGGEVCTLIVPGWPHQPTVEARDDGLNEVTVVVAACHDNERWRLVRLRKGVLCAIVYLTGGKLPEGRVRRSHYDMVVRMPPEKVATIRVLTHSPDNTDAN